MVILGVILIVLGLVVASLHVLLWIGLVLLVVGLILNFVPMGGTRRRVFCPSQERSRDFSRSRGRRFTARPRSCSPEPGGADSAIPPISGSQRVSSGDHDRWHVRTSA
jgi:hypothetical protein